MKFWISLRIIFSIICIIAIVLVCKHMLNLDPESLPIILLFGGYILIPVVIVGIFGFTRR